MSVENSIDMKWYEYAIHMYNVMDSIIPHQIHENVCGQINEGIARISPDLYEKIQSRLDACNDDTKS